MLAGDLLTAGKPWGKAAQEDLAHGALWDLPPFLLSQEPLDCTCSKPI